MSLEALAAEITKQAKEEAESILDEARAEAKRIEEEARGEATQTSSMASSKSPFRRKRRLGRNLRGHCRREECP